MMNYLYPFFRSIKVLHSQVFVSVFAVVLILLVPQMKDLVLIFSEEAEVVQTVLALVGISLLSFTLWVSGRWMTIQCLELEPDENKRNLNFWEIWVPRVLGVAPQVALIVVIIRLMVESKDEIKTLSVLLLYVIVTTLSAANFIFQTFKRKKNKGYRSADNDSFIMKSRGIFSSPIWTYMVLFGYVSIMLATLLNQAAVTQHLGTLFLVFSFLAFLTSILTLINWKSRKHNFSYLGLLMLVAVFIAWKDSGDNHQLALAAIPNETDSVKVTTASHAFSNWLLADDGIKTVEHENNKIPIYLVAAQGGGIYAAFHAAMTLATLEDYCPGFSDHLFAISGVSGGSLGSALFVDLVRERRVSAQPALIEAEDLPTLPDNIAGFESLPHCKSRSANVDQRPDNEPPPLRPKVWQAFQDDWLSPVVARTLFAEPFLTFVPVPCSLSWKAGQETNKSRLKWETLYKLCSTYDQAKALEASLERSTNNVVAEGSALSLGVSSFHSIGERLPNLMINTADATAGNRVVIAPFRVSAPGMQFFSDYIPKGREPTIKEAAVLSARFPFVTQAGFWKGERAADLLCQESTSEFCEMKDGRTPSLKVRFVDGGYNDNTGLQTIQDLINEIRAENSEIVNDLEFHIIALTGLNSRSLSGNAFNELATPIKAMLKMWGGKARELREEFIDQLSENNTDKFYQARLDIKSGSIPLGWRLSARSRERIVEQISEHGLEQMSTGN